MSEEGTISKVYGHTAGLKRSQLRLLDNLARRRVPPADLVTPELARGLVDASRELNRQVGVLLDRRGSVDVVLVGTADGLEIPDLGRGRASPGRLLGVRLIHTHLRDQPLTRDDLTDLTLLRLDAIAAICVGRDGLPGRVYAAHLTADPDEEPYELLAYPSPHALDLDVAWLVESIEADFARRLHLREVGADGERAILVGVESAQDGSTPDSLAELKELARTAGLRVVDVITQRRTRVDPRYVLGKGKVAELVVRSKQLGAELIVFDRNLSAAQIRNVAGETDQKIIDRTQLILDIFAQHARSREGKIQVELAQLRYLLPRLTGRGTAMSRLAGGIGARGPGESKLETDRRLIRKRIGLLERQLAQLSRGREQRRALRNREQLPIVSIVGYTNAGKSTLLNRLTSSRVLAEDKLFATLDTATRRLRFPRERDVIVTDTVGFIRDLPPELVTAFRATLEELADADLLLHVVDASSPALRDHMDEVRRTLRELELGAKPELVVYNKIDRLVPEERRPLRREPGAVLVSALDGEGMEELVAALRRRLGFPSSHAG